MAVSRCLIDTNIYSHAQRGVSEVIKVLQCLDEIAICSISIGELLSGFKRGLRQSDNRRELAEFLDAPRVQVLSVDETTAEFYAEVLDSMQQAGQPIPTNDVWIAAVAFQHGARLYSMDHHFGKVPGLALIS